MLSFIPYLGDICIIVIKIFINNFMDMYSVSIKILWSNSKLIKRYILRFSGLRKLLNGILNLLLTLTQTILESSEESSKFFTFRNDEIMHHWKFLMCLHKLPAEWFRTTVPYRIDNKYAFYYQSHTLCKHKFLP